MQITTNLTSQKYVKASTEQEATIFTSKGDQSISLCKKKKEKRHGIMEIIINLFIRESGNILFASLKRHAGGYPSIQQVSISKVRMQSKNLY